MIPLARVLGTLFLLLISPLMWLAAVALLAVADLAWLLAGRRTAPRNQACRRNAASVVIPNWNGRDLLAQYLPSVITALAGNSENEIIVVDNGSTDGSADFVRQAFPGVTLLRARTESGVRRRLERRLPRRAERYRGAAEQRHAGVAGFPGAAPRRLRRRTRVRRLLPDLLSRPRPAPRGNRPDRKAGGRMAD